jgi:hypothetical protein
MEKEYSSQYPGKETKHLLSFNRALIGMLNCRRYLQSQGLEGNSGTLGAGGIELIFPDGYTLNYSDFGHAEDKNIILEEIITKKAVINQKGKVSYLRKDRERGLNCTLEGNFYRVYLKMKDRTREGIRILRIGHKAELFSIDYNLDLTREIIEEANIEKFEKLKQGLEEAVKQETLTTFSPGTTSIRQPEQPEEMPQTGLVVNPWEVDIPRRGEENE